MTVKKAAPKKKAAPRKTKLTDKDKEFVNLYIGGPDECRGNATACYKYLNPKAKQRTAETQAYRVLKKPEVQNYMKDRVAIIEKNTEINAQYVLEQSVRLFEACMGEIEMPDTISMDVPLADGGTEKKVIEVMKKEFNPQGAKGALELIGKNIIVQAFQERIDVSGKLDLADIMARRQKVIEGKARESSE